jgi:hypothetical protein
MPVIAPTIGYTGFTITVDTTLVGSASDTFIIPKPGSGVYNYTVNWGDGNIETNVLNTDHSHTYSVGGIYTIQIFGTFPQIRFNNLGDRLKLLSIDNWGNIAWSSMDRAFFGCEVMIIPARDAPDLSGVTTLMEMLRKCMKFNQPINHWDVSMIQIFGSIFRDCDLFNQLLNLWVTSSGTDFSNFLRNCGAYNQPLNSLDTSSATTLAQFLRNCTVFNQPLNLLDTSLVTTMVRMIENCPAFDQDLGSLNITSLTTADMMLLSSTLSTANYNSLLTGWEGQVELTSVVFGGGNATHSGAGTTARGVLVGTSLWTITDNGAA